MFLSASSFIHYGKQKKNAEIGYECATAAVVKIIFEESGVGDVVVNSRILNVFKKISVLQTAYTLFFFSIRIYFIRISRLKFAKF